MMASLYVCIVTDSVDTEVKMQQGSLSLPAESPTSLYVANHASTHWETLDAFFLIQKMLKGICM